MVKTNNTSKKAILIRNVAASNYGGGETYQIKIANLLKDYGVEPIIITNSNKLLEQARNDGFQSLRPPYSKRQNWSGPRMLLLPIYAFFLFKQYQWYKKQFKRLKPSTVNIQSRDDQISATLAAKKLKIKTIWTDHADFRNWTLWNIDKPFKNPIGKRIAKLMKYPKAIFLVSDFERKWLLGMLKGKENNNIKVFKNSVEDLYSTYKNIQSSQHGVIFLGRITKEKGIYELLNAFEEAQKTVPDARLDIYGSGEELSNIKKLKIKNIYCHGSITNQYEALSRSSIFIQSSYNEGLSLSLIEAMMMKKAIIATDVGATSEAIEHNKSGILIQPHSAKEIERNMIDLMTNPKRAEALSENARKRYSEQFNLRKNFEAQMLKYYK